MSNTYAGQETVKEAVDNLFKVQKFNTYPITHTRSPYIVDKIGGEKIVSEETIGDFKRDDIEVYVVKNDKLYIFDFRYKPENKQKILTLADQILSNFKFTP